jgi:predicted amidohydrolase
MASVAKTAKGLDGAVPTLAEIARKYSMTVLMANCVGESDGGECAGNTAVWNSKGLLVGQLDDRNEGILLFDTDTEEVAARTL